MNVQTDRETDFLLAQCTNWKTNKTPAGKQGEGDDMVLLSGLGTRTVSIGLHGQAPHAPGCPLTPVESWTSPSHTRHHVSKELGAARKARLDSLRPLQQLYVVQTEDPIRELVISIPNRIWQGDEARDTVTILPLS